MGKNREAGENERPLIAYAPPLHPDKLGDPGLKNLLGIRYAYVCGAMANGITSVEMVEAAGRAGMIGFFGAAGLLPDEIEAAIIRLSRFEAKFPYGFNLIHSPNEMTLEWETVNRYLKHGINLISASAYLDLTPALVYFRIKGVLRNTSGGIMVPNRIVAKVSRVEVARKFMAPPAGKLISGLMDKGLITRDEAELASRIPMADAVTAEADSGGHTDNRPALTLLPTMITLRDELVAQHRFDQPVHVGLGGGIATPEAAAAAFAMGAAYVLTGSINQSCTEAGTSEPVRKMLCAAQQADVTMAPAADMFELGVKVQVLKRGTMFSMRAAKLYDLYRTHDMYEQIPATIRATLEKDFFRKSFAEEWEKTRAFFNIRDPEQIRRAEDNPKHKMALVFRSYLGQSSGWATRGDASRVIDYQIWCGPGMGAFNQWVKGSFLEKPENRRTVTVAHNLMFGAAIITRIGMLRHQAVWFPQSTGTTRPMTMDTIREKLCNDV
ncbi:MAG: PfaD family polyunsaturated fatty acid/polyketide biosynthesis protein [Desulfobacteraceae bacterium]|nr:PfaD family polyunsaturated fatty acid/polyketide biosynthesis protein [Desulfobacteraceae bacterium]